MEDAAPNRLGVPAAEAGLAPNTLGDCCVPDAGPALPNKLLCPIGAAAAEGGSDDLEAPKEKLGVDDAGAADDAAG